MFIIRKNIFVYLFFTDISIIFFKRIKAIFVQIERIKRFVQAFNKDGIGHHASFISDQFFFIKLTLFFSFRQTIKFRRKATMRMNAFVDSRKRATTIIVFSNFTKFVIADFNSYQFPIQIYINIVFKQLQSFNPTNNFSPKSLLNCNFTNTTRPSFFFVRLQIQYYLPNFRTKESKQLDFKFIFLNASYKALTRAESLKKASLIRFKESSGASL